MRQIDVKENEAGQRLDKFLHKYMPLAPSSFFYKMLRKKNITLNGGRAEGKEKLALGDIVCLYLSEDTISGFQKANGQVTEYEEAYQKLKGICVLYEDADFLIMDKPVNLLSQKAKDGDLSLNEWMIGYLLAEGGLRAEQLATFKPGVCNRLDRNTGGLVLGAKSLRGSQEINALIRTHQIKKFYRLFVAGTVDKKAVLEGYLVKDRESNRVKLVQEKTDDASYIRTEYNPLEHYADRTLLEAMLITGKSHQIRIQMAGAGHPIIGDAKYGDPRVNERYRKVCKVRSQMLYACRLEMPEIPSFPAISGRIFNAPEPEIFLKLRKYKTEL